MNDQLRELYQEVVIDHNRSPRNFGELPPPARELNGHNPLCGDKIKLSLRMNGDCIDDIKFSGEGCAISVASASLMTEAVKGLSAEEAKHMTSGLLEMMVGDDREATASGKLAALKGVRDFPGRVKCATLAWHTLEALLDNGTGVVSTE